MTLELQGSGLKSLLWESWALARSIWKSW